MKVDNAIIMAAGMSTRFVPLCFETHKALIQVKNEVLIERQIKQLIEKNIKNIYIITGYKSNQFEYLKEKFNIKLVYNKEYSYRNNNSSIWAAKDLLSNSYVLSSDNYFSINPFDSEVDDSYYAALYAENKTNEWCMTLDEEGYINSVVIGGSKSWYMMGHTFWSEDFSKKFLNILYNEYNLKETESKLWEAIFLSHLDILKMKIKKYDKHDIYEFDTLDELRTFDKSYIDDTRSKILKEIAKELNVLEGDINNLKPLFDIDKKLIGFNFNVKLKSFYYLLENRKNQNLNTPHNGLFKGKLNSI